MRINHSIYIFYAHWFQMWGPFDPENWQSKPFQGENQSSLMKQTIITNRLFVFSVQIQKPFYSTLFLRVLFHLFKLTSSTSKWFWFAFSVSDRPHVWSQWAQEICVSSFDPLWPSKDNDWPNGNKWISDSKLATTFKIFQNGNLTLLVG